MPDTEEPPEIGPEQLDAVLRYLPIFSQPGYVFGEWHMPEGQFPFYAYNDEVMEFIQELSNQDIVYVFNWVEWQEEAQRYMTDPEALQQADLLTLRRLLVTHLRTDRFVEGHLASMMENAHITAILRRMSDIRDQM